MPRLREVPPHEVGDRAEPVVEVATPEGRGDRDTSQDLAGGS